MMRIKNKEHPLYTTWLTMRTRCNNPNAENYLNYGGRGIKVDPRWDDFWQFVDDMGERPPAHTLERKDNDGPYSPENCIWASRRKQAANRRARHDHRYITHNGHTKTLAEWARVAGLHPNTLGARLRYGWDFQKAITKPSKRKPKHQPEP